MSIQSVDMGDVCFPPKVYLPLNSCQTHKPSPYETARTATKADRATDRPNQRAEPSLALSTFGEAAQGSFMLNHRLAGFYRMESLYGSLLVIPLKLM